MKSVIRGLLLGLLSIMVITPVLAAPANPDSITVSDIAVFRDVIVSGDQLWYMRYDLEYTVEPSESASTTFYIVLFDTDGVTERYSRGVTHYQEDIISIYLSPEEALVWGGAYYMRLMGNPGLFDPLIEGTNMRTRVLGPGDYREGSTLGAYMIEQALLLEEDLGTTLVGSTNKLNAAGSLIFLGGIPGLQDMDNTIFEDTSYVPSMYEESTNTTYEEELLTRKGPRLEDDIQGIADMLGTKPEGVQIGITALGASMVAALAFAPTGNPGVGLLIGGLAIPACVSIGILPATIWVMIVMLIFIVGGILAFKFVS